MFSFSVTLEIWFEMLLKNGIKIENDLQDKSTPRGLLRKLYEIITCQPLA
jgi:hypothetical protein